MRQCSFAVVLALAILGYSSVPCLKAADPSLGSSDWVLYKKGPLTQEEVICALIKNGSLELKDDSATFSSSRIIRPTKEPFAYELMCSTSKGQLDPANINKLYGLWCSIPVNDGWLLAYDAGEYGGYVQWIGKDKKAFYTVSESHVSGFIASPDGPLALATSGHVLIDGGSLVYYKKNIWGRWKERTKVTFKSQPLVAIPHVGSECSYLVSTRSSLVDIASSNASTLVYKYPTVVNDDAPVMPPGGGTLFPLDISVTANGDIVLTMGFLLLVLHKDDTGNAHAKGDQGGRAKGDHPWVRE